MNIYAVEIILRQNWSIGMFDVCSFYSCMQELDLFWCFKLSKWYIFHKNDKGIALVIDIQSSILFLTNIDSSKGRFIYILDSSNSSSFTFWSSQFTSSSRSNWTSIWTGNSNGTWTDKQSSHFSTANEIRVKATFFFM